MTERNPPVWMQSGTYDAMDDRLVTGLLSDRTFAADGTGSTITGGVVPGVDQLRVTAPGNTMDVLVSAGTVIVPSISTASGGAYLCHNDGQTTLTLGIEASGNPRIDTIYAVVEDQTTGGATSSWRLDVAKGAPSANPIAPTLVAGQFPLANVRVVPASQNGGVNKVTSAQITDLRVFASGPGGVHLVKNGVPLPAASPGRLVFNVDTKVMSLCNGTQWLPILVQGSVDVPGSIDARFAALRPTHVAPGHALMWGSAGWTNNWIENPMPYGTTNTSVRVPPAVVTSQSPSGWFRVTVGARMNNTQAGGNAIMSVRVRNGATVVFNPENGTWRSACHVFPSQTQIQQTFLLTGMPANTNLTFTIAYMKTGVVASQAGFVYPYMLVEPVA